MDVNHRRCAERPTDSRKGLPGCRSKNPRNGPNYRGKRGSATAGFFEIEFRRFAREAVASLEPMKACELLSLVSSHSREKARRSRI
jgi:hypothetical protein